MKRRNRALRKTICIVCVGQTEQRYFQALSEIVNNSDEYHVTAIIPVIHHGSKQDPLGMVTEAQRMKMDFDYDEVWAVFDKDGDEDAQIKETAFAFAIQNDVNVAFSSISFEVWILMHFERCYKAFAKCDCSSRGDDCICEGTICVLSYLVQKHYPTYQKASYKTFTDTYPRINHALINCEWLRHKNSKKNIVKPIANPYTDVDLLINKLFGFEKVLFLEEIINYKDLEIEVESITESNTKIEISVIIKNHRTSTEIVRNSQFELILDKELLESVDPTRILITPNSSDKLNLTYDLINEEGNPSPNKYLVYSENNNKMVFKIG